MSDHGSGFESSSDEKDAPKQSSGQQGSAAAAITPAKQVVGKVPSRDPSKVLQRQMQQVLPAEVNRRIHQKFSQTDYEAHKLWFLDTYVPGGGQLPYMDLIGTACQLEYSECVSDPMPLATFRESKYRDDDQLLLDEIDVIWGIVSDDKTRIPTLLRKVKMEPSSAYAKDTFTEYKSDFNYNLHSYPVLLDRASPKEIVNAFYDGVQPPCIRSMMMERKAGSYDEVREQHSQTVITMEHVLRAVRHNVVTFVVPSTVEPDAFSSEEGDLRGADGGLALKASVDTTSKCAICEKVGHTYQTCDTLCEKCPLIPPAVKNHTLRKCPVRREAYQKSRQNKSTAPPPTSSTANNVITFDISSQVDRDMMLAILMAENPNAVK